MDFQSDKRPPHARDVHCGLLHSVSALIDLEEGHYIEGPNQTFATKVAVSFVFLSLQYTYHPTLMSMSEFQSESIKAEMLAKQRCSVKNAKVPGRNRGQVVGRCNIIVSLRVKRFNNCKKARVSPAHARRRSGHIEKNFKRGDSQVSACSLRRASSCYLQKTANSSSGKACD